MFALHNSRITGTILLIVYAWVQLVAAIANCPANPDPCTSHSKLNGAQDHTRSSKFYNSSVPTYGDAVILEGWYHADAGAGGDMPTEAPNNGYCQATYPIWLQGTLPSPGDGIVQRTACVRGFSNACSSTLSICIKSCNVGGEEYNVYWLPRPTVSLSRYCFGSLLQCPDPKQGFGPPCLDYLDNDPVITYSSQKNPVPGNNFFNWVQTYFHCNVVHSKTTIYLDFEWSVDGDIIKTHQNIKYTEQDSAKLTPDDLKNSNIKIFGINLRCKVRPRSTFNGALNKPKLTEFYVGFKAVNTGITVAEGGPIVNYIFHTTAPIDCVTPANTQLHNVECSLIVQIVVPKIDGKDADCTQSGIANKLTFAVSKSFGVNPQPCTIELKSKPFVAGNKLVEYTLPVKAVQNGKYDGTKEFALQLRITETIDPPSPWAGMMLPRAQITVKDKDQDLQSKSCMVYNDPHVRTFDGRYYEMQMEGVFVVYRQITGIPLEIQGYFKRPSVGTKYTIVCGIAIRSYGELFVLNHCGGNTFHAMFYQCTTQNVGGSAIKNLVVNRAGSVWTIGLPNGGKVVYHRGWKFTIEPGLSDYKNTEGLCGYLSDTCNDDLKLKNSQEKEDDPNCVCGKHCGFWSFYADKFSKSWRVNEKIENSLFTGIISDERKFKDVIFCGCTGQGANLAASCSYDGVTSNACIKQGEDETDKYKRWCGLSKKKRSTGPKSDDLQDEYKYIPGQYDENYVAPAYSWTNGWTEDSARTYCNDFYSNRKAVSLCKDVAGVNVNASKESCIQDIYITGTTNYSLVGVDNIISDCKTEIQKNITLFVTNTTDSNGTTISLGDLLLSSLCPNDCSDHGTCENGKCMCEDDYTSVDCSEDKHHVTELKNIPFESVCDVNVRKCQESIVYGDLFIESDNLTCRTQAMNMDGKDVSGFSYFKGRYEHFQKILCPLFKTLPPYILNIAVSNDNETFSNPKPLLVFDSNCWNCSVISGCTKKDSSCVIQEICYEEGVMNPINSDEICRPKMNQYGWTSTATNVPELTTVDSSTATEQAMQSTHPKTTLTVTTNLITAIKTPAATTPIQTRMITSKTPEMTTIIAQGQTTIQAPKANSGTNPSAPATAQTSVNIASSKTTTLIGQGQITNILPQAQNTAAQTPMTTVSKQNSPTTTILTQSQTSTVTSQDPSSTLKVKTTATTYRTKTITTTTAKSTTNNLGEAAKRSGTESDNIGLAAGIGVAVVLIAVVVICFIIYKLKSRSPPAEKGNLNQGESSPETQRYHKTAAGSSYMRPQSAKSSDGRPLSPSSDIHLEDDVSPVILDAWAPPATTFTPKSFNFKEMRPTTGTQPNNLLQPLEHTDIEEYDWNN